MINIIFSPLTTFVQKIPWHFLRQSTLSIKMTKAQTKAKRFKKILLLHIVVPSWQLQRFGRTDLIENVVLILMTNILNGKLFR